MWMCMRLRVDGEVRLLELKRVEAQTLANACKQEKVVLTDAGHLIKPKSDQ